MAFLNPQQIARELVNPTQRWTWVVIGDSRFTAKETYAMTYQPSIAWTGMRRSSQTQQPGSGTSYTSAVGGEAFNVATPSPYIGTVQDWYLPGGGVETRFSGGTIPNAGQNSTNMRLTTAFFSKTNYPLLFAGLHNNPADVEVKCTYYKHAGGMASVPGIRNSFRHGSSSNFNDPGCYQSPYIYDVTGSGYGTLTTIVPSGFDWQGKSNFSAEIVATPGGSTVNLQTVSVSAQVVQKVGPGVVYYAAASGGWNVEGWLSETAVPTAVFSQFLPQIVENPIFQLDLGTNNPSSNNATQHATKMIALIAKIRTAYPDAPIILTTSYATSTSGADPYWREGARMIRDAVDGVWLLDTYSAMPTFDQGVLLGYYALPDDVHYLPAGVTALFQKMDEMIASAAVSGLPISSGIPTITSPTLTQLIQLDGLSITTGVPTITAGTLSLQPPPLRIVNLSYKWRATQSAGTSTATPPTFIAYRGHALDMGMFTIAAPAGFSFQGTVARLRIGRPGEAAHVEWRSDDVPSGVLFGWNDATGELSIDMPSAAVDVQDAGRYTYQITIISTSGEPLGPPCVGYFRVASTVGAMLN